MISILLISKEDGVFVGLKSGLKQYDEVEFYRVYTSNKALDIISGEGIDLVVADEEIADMTGIEFAKKLVSVNPMISCALLSPLSPKGFHEATEGLGILAQLPVRPDEKQAKILLDRLKGVLGLTQKLEQH